MFLFMDYIVEQEEWDKKFELALIRIIFLFDLA